MVQLGVNLTPIIFKRVVDLPYLRGRSVAVDAFNILHQFLALIRTRDGKPLMDKEGHFTSHLVGLAFRSTRLLVDYHMRLVYVFDGKPQSLKSEELERRSTIKRKAEQEYAAAIKEADYANAFSKAVMTGRLTAEVEADSKRLLDLLGIPWVQAPSEGEAQAAYMSQKGDVWGVNSRDYDSLLFGAPRLIRYLTIHGEEWLPSKGKTRRLKPEIVELKAFLMHNGINREQLVDLAIMIGTDFNPGVKGIGPKTALKLIEKHGRLECMPDEVVDKLPDNFEEIRRIFHEPEVTDDYSISWGTPREEDLLSFLCEERSFSRERVELILGRMKRFHLQKSLKDWTRG